RPQADGASPFAGYGPDAGSMTAGAEVSRSQSLGVLAIVGGVVVTVGAGLVLAALVIVLLFVYRQQTEGGDLAAADKAARHVKDTGVAGPIDNTQPAHPRPGKAKTPVPGDPSVHDPSAGPPPGPATLIVPNEQMFLSIEVNCPGGYRSRGSFRKDTAKTMRATVPNVPGDERCTVTFQGSEPAKTWVSGNQTKTCTFNPVVCHDVF
ncbi:MAG: hypothetical protein ABMB14_31115, partial [Myxococcota bacterium]